MAVIAPSEHERRAALGGGDLAGANVGDRDGVEPVQAPEGGHRRAQELLGAGRDRGEAFLDQVRHHLGVRLGAEAMTGAHERLAQLAVVGDDAVVDEREAARAVQVWVCVGLGHASVRGPAGVADADGAGGQVRRRVADLAGTLGEDDLVTVADGHAPGIVAPILELLESSQDEVRRILSVSDVSEDPAHGCPPAGRPHAQTERARRKSRDGSA